MTSRSQPDFGCYTTCVYTEAQSERGKEFRTLSLWEGEGRGDGTRERFAVPTAADNLSR